MLNKKTQKKVFYCKKKIITYLKLCAYAQQELKLKKIWEDAIAFMHLILRIFHKIKSKTFILNLDKFQFRTILIT